MSADRTCTRCNAPPTKLWPYCHACVSVFGQPLVFWITVCAVAVGSFALATHRMYH